MAIYNVKLPFNTYMSHKITSTKRFFFYEMLCIIYYNIWIGYVSYIRVSYCHACYHKVPVTVVGVVELVPEPPLVGSGVG